MPATTQILVIEDNAANRELMIVLLEAYGYVVLTAANGELGVRAARASRPALILCDVHMPKLDGFGVVRELKSDPQTREIPIVAVTAFAMVGDRDRILGAGFDGYIGKPIVPESFVEQCERYLPGEARSTVAPHVESTPVAEEQSAAAPNGRTVLLIDDTPANLDFTRSTLEASGYRVLTAPGVREALLAAARQPIHLVLTDLHMWPLTGSDLLRLAQAEPALAGVPLIVISSTFTGGAERAECLARGASGFIVRPIEPAALLAEVAYFARMSPSAPSFAPFNP